MPADTIIADRAEFIDALRQLRRGRVLVRAKDTDSRCLLDGSFAYTAYQPLARYRLIDEFANPQGFPNVHYHRPSPPRRAFDHRARETRPPRPRLHQPAAGPHARTRSEPRRGPTGRCQKAAPARGRASRSSGRHTAGERQTTPVGGSAGPRGYTPPAACARAGGLASSSSLRATLIRARRTGEQNSPSAGTTPPAMA